MTPTQDTNYEMFSTIGFDSYGAAKDRSSLFAAAGIEWPENADMEFELGRFTHYPFSVDISNNRLLVALDRNGSIRRAVSALGIKDVRGEQIPGVYVNKVLAFTEGHATAALCIDKLPWQSPSLSFIEGIIPIFESKTNGVIAQRTIFVPQTGFSACAQERPLKVVQLITLHNTTQDVHTATLSRHIDLRSKNGITAMNVSLTIVDADGNHHDDTMTIDIAPESTAIIAAFFDFSVEAQLHQSNAATLEEAKELFSSTLEYRRGTMGKLHTPDDPWYGEVLTRSAELARQSILLLEDGSTVGSFWGSNANPLPDVWTRDFAYSAMGVIESDPQLASKAIDLLAKYGIPDKAWQRESRIHPEASGFEHSLGNACLAAVLASMLITRYGINSLNVDHQNFNAYLDRLATDLIASHPKSGNLYHTLYISDGPSRGDFHTGSNILAWKAARALADIFATNIGAQRAQTLAAIADDLKTTIASCCVGRINGSDMFVEGVNSDGRMIGVHDGEESELTLASVYGFTDRDDERIREHAKWAWSNHDPYYASRTGGIDFWDFDDSNGVTYPGHIHYLCSTSHREEITTAFKEIRKTTDLDGSFWWWPFKHAETDPSRVKRGLGKCGWCAGEFVSMVMHDIAGIRRDTTTNTVTVMPYTPWERFSWEGLAFGDGTIDVNVTQCTISITNNTSSAINTILEIPLAPNSMIDNVQVNGKPRRYQADVLRQRDCSSIRTTETVDPGKTVKLQITQI